jgi:hypothetical protein
MIVLHWSDLPKIQDVRAYEKFAKDALLPIVQLIERYRYSGYVLLLWLLLSVLVAIFASRIKGRSGVGFFLLALFLSPLLAFLVALIVRTDQWAAARKRGLKQCEHCGRYVPREAVTCRYCRGNFI